MTICNCWGQNVTGVSWITIDSQEARAQELWEIAWDAIWYERAALGGWTQKCVRLSLGSKNALGGMDSKKKTSRIMHHTSAAGWLSNFFFQYRADKGCILGFAFSQSVKLQTGVSHVTKFPSETWHKLLHSCVCSTCLLKLTLNHQLMLALSTFAETEAPPSVYS